MRSGDIVFLRVGYSRRKREQGPRPVQLGQAGWHAAALPWLHEREVAVIGNDGGQDAMPSGYHQHGLGMPIHAIGIVAMGLWLIDNLDLEPLAEACESRQRWTFFMHLSPLRLSAPPARPSTPSPSSDPAHAPAVLLAFYRRRVQPVGATSSASRSDGFMHPRVLRGRLLRLWAMASRSASAVDGEVGAFGHVLAEQAVGVLVASRVARASGGRRSRSGCRCRW